MEKFNQNITGGEEVNNDLRERLKSLSIVGEKFGGDVGNFKKQIELALDQESRGMYKRGTAIFCEMIWGKQEISPMDFGRYKKEINSAIKIIEQGNDSDNSQVKKQDLIKNIPGIMKSAEGKEKHDKWIEEEILGRRE
jgi:hypothetical protein